MCLLSIIVPVYNGEKCIDTCISTIQQQNVYDFEVIFVNDGSKDGTTERIQSHMLKNANIQLINTTNFGVSHARNIGMNEAHGKYVAFLDCDDVLTSDMYNTMLKKAETANADIISCATEHRYLTHSEYEFNTGKIYCFSKNEAVETFLNGEIINISACSKIFRREILENVKFCELFKINEDKLFIYEAILNSQCIICIDMAYYIYLQNEASVTHSNSDVRWLDMKRVADRITELTKEKAEFAQKACTINRFLTYQHLYRIMTRTSDFRKKYNGEYTEILQEMKKMYMDINKDITIKIRIEYYIACMGISIYVITLHAYDMMLRKKRRNL